MSPTPLIVFSHLRWGFVYQRPQHLLSRLARRRRVLFVEEPVHEDGPPRWVCEEAAPGVTVCRAHTPVSAPGFHPDQMPVLRQMLATLLDAERVGRCAAWFYTPMAVPLLDELDAETVVFDCMDELRLFAGAPPELADRERTLLAAADVVFTGGRSLFEARRDLHPNVHCFPSSVDAAHFRQAVVAPLPEPAAQAALPRPRLGYVGVIDERLDYDLLAHLAGARPDWQIVMVGPVVKVDPASLPQAPNLHYLGPADYADLPAYLAGWDVALLPFALNDATRFISPTKTLEYMAAERPMVSTPIADVAGPYGHIVGIADTPEAFVEACEAALGAGASEREAQVEAMRVVLAGTSWGRTARAMERLLDAAADGNADGVRRPGSRHLEAVAPPRPTTVAA